ncbi:site-2 protease family protein [Actinomadura sp. DC4]|uniref:site-2 protease family protein n=1 Tax=Actinomadura sp. DC4 TaxID=3055069 RepID=UPI0025B01AFF|nr:site-2 protease family protein [Actinomadura sp. DC4]MDN3355227.1 site-2 protease family protein [Actinomadura sp. DC4]
MADSAPRGDESGPARPGILMGRPFGIPVYVSPTWFVVAIVITVMFEPQVAEHVHRPLSYVVALAYAILLYASVLLHEIGHSVVARCFGLPVRAITLHILGGVSEIEQEPRTPGREFLVAAAGPLLSLVLGAAGYVTLVLVPLPAVAVLLIQALTIANLIVGVFNLLPGLPLDGGRIVRAAVWKLTGRQRTATVAAGWAGRVVAVAVLILGAVLSVSGDGGRWLTVIWAALVASFIWVGAGEAIRVARIRDRIPLLNARALARRAVRVPQSTPLAEAVRRAQEAGAGAIVVVGHDDDPLGIVSETAVIATPEHRRPWVDAASLTRTLDPGMILPADISGEDLVAAISRAPASEYLLVEPTGELYGVLAAEDISKTFARA